MKSLAIFYFYQELAEQCMFAKMAKVDLKKCRMTDAQGLNRLEVFNNSVVKSIQVFI